MKVDTYTGTVYIVVYRHIFVKISKFIIFKMLIRNHCFIIVAGYDLHHIFDIKPICVTENYKKMYFIYFFFL